MLVIRLARTGRNKYPTYRIVAAESARAATGRFVSILGHYNPHTKELVIKKAETEKYLSNGAQPSNTVIKLLQREEIALPGWVQLKTRKRPSKSEPAPEEPKAEVAAETAADEAAAPAEVAEAPVVEETAAVVAEAETETKAEAADDDATPTAASETEAADKAEAAEEAAAEVATEATE